MSARQRSLNQNQTEKTPALFESKQTNRSVRSPAYPSHLSRRATRVPRPYLNELELEHELVAPFHPSPSPTSVCHAKHGWLRQCLGPGADACRYPVACIHGLLLSAVDRHRSHGWCAAGCRWVCRRPLVSIGIPNLRNGRNPVSVFILVLQSTSTPSPGPRVRFPFRSALAPCSRRYRPYRTSFCTVSRRGRRRIYGVRRFNKIGTKGCGELRCVPLVCQSAQCMQSDGHGHEVETRCRGVGGFATWSVRVRLFKRNAVRASASVRA